jgi:outer membrane receptor protein involved in Fe transport
MYRARKLILTLFALLIVIGVAFAQGSGKIVGSIIDKENGEGLIGANVYLDGTEFGSVTDFDGTYVIVGIPDGNYVLVVSYIGYNEIRIQNVVLAGGNTQKYDLAMETESFETDVLVVEAEAVTNSEASLLKLRQKATSVSDAISAEEISKSGSGDAAAAMKKVTGASVVGGKYVYVRGLGDRYTSTSLNGAEVPSADPDRKSFQMDLIPSSMLENINTQKTFTPDKPGTFTGGLVDVRLKDSPEDFTLTFNSSVGYNSVTTAAGNFIVGERGDTDWLGFDDGTRELPDYFKNLNNTLEDRLFYLNNDDLFPTDADKRAEALRIDRIYHSFGPVMSPRSSYAPYNGSFGLSVGNTHWFDEQKQSIGYFGSLTYGREAKFIDDAEVGRYKMDGDPDTTPTLDGEELIGNYTKGTIEANWGAIANVAYKNADYGKLKLAYMRTQSGINEGTYIDAKRDRDQTSNRRFETYVTSWTERALDNYQVDGEHLIPFLGDLKMDWLLSFSENTQDEPDQRYFFNVYSYEDDGVTIDRAFDGANSQPLSRYYRDLKEDVTTFNLNLEWPFEQWGGLKARVKTGVAMKTTNRVYNQRRFDYAENNVDFNDDHGGNIDSLFINGVGIIDSTNSSYRKWFGMYMTSKLDSINFFRGDMRVNAAYFMVDLPLMRDLRMIAGARYETTKINSGTLDPKIPRGLLDNSDLLPSVNIIYALEENMNLRMVYSNTIARPTFRELAPYESFEFVGDFVIKGNSDLRRTYIANWDLRWEWFTNPGEIVAASVFYKRFFDPIERYADPARDGDNTFFFKANVPDARVYGLELEYRQSLGVIDNLIGMHGVFSDVKLGTNFSYVFSEVDVPEEEIESLERNFVDNPDKTRPFVGQSPVLANVNLAYDNYESGTSAGIYYNYFGDRLYLIGRNGTPNVFEKGFGTLDFKASQALGENFSASLSIKNILDPDQYFVYKLDNDVTTKEFTYSRYKTGTTISLGFSYKM